MIQEIAQMLRPWKDLYEDSVVLSTGVTTAHVLSLVVGGGFALAADRTTLRTLSCPGHARPWLLEELRGVHRPVLIGIVILTVSGLLMMAADFPTYVRSVVFWVKMGLIVLLLANGAILYRAESTLTRTTAKGVDPAPHWCTWLRRSTWLSIGLWVATTVVGMLLTVAGSSHE
jgi:hypothetical protein